MKFEKSSEIKENEIIAPIEPVSCCEEERRAADKGESGTEFDEKRQ